MVNFLVNYIGAFEIHWFFKELLGLISLFLFLRFVSSLFLRSWLYAQKRKTKWVYLYSILITWKALDLCLLILVTIFLLCPQQGLYTNPRKIFFFGFFAVLGFFILGLSLSNTFILGYTFLFILNICFIQYQHLVL